MYTCIAVVGHGECDGGDGAILTFVCLDMTLGYTFFDACFMAVEECEPAACLDYTAVVNTYTHGSSEL